MKTKTKTPRSKLVEIAVPASAASFIRWLAEAPKLYSLCLQDIADVISTPENAVLPADAMESLIWQVYRDHGWQERFAGDAEVQRFRAEGRPEWLRRQPVEPEGDAE